MKIIIDEQVCLKYKLTLPEALLLVAIKHLSSHTITNMKARGILEKSNPFEISDEWSAVIDKVLKASGSDVNDEERLKALAKRMQKCFPEGKMPGTPYYYRCNTSEIVKKLRKFFEKHGEYSDEQIVDATKRFVASFSGNYKYLPLIKYFISKFKTVQDEEGVSHTVEYFPLADFLENQEDGNVDSDDWLLDTRN